MVSINEVNINRTRLAKHHSISLCDALVGVAGRIITATVSFNLNDSSCDCTVRSFSNQNLSKQFSGYNKTDLE